MASTNSTASSTTTTISSIAVQSGNTRLVIALLQVSLDTLVPMDLDTARS